MSKMPARREYIFPIHFLVYTRSTSLDYQWVYGLDDKSVESALQEHIVKWLNTNLLGKLPTVTTLFRFQKYCALMIAEKSDTRKDAHERAIFQRAIFLWEKADGFYYKHLEPLADYLANEAEKVYRKLPDDALRLSSESKQFDVSLNALNDEVSKKNIKKDCWELPEHLTWQDVVRGKLTVEVPDSWSFDKMIAGLANQPLSVSEMIFIGNSIHAENRLPLDQSWIVSAKESNGSSSDSLVRILKNDGQPLQPLELKQYEGKKIPKASASDQSKSFTSRGTERQQTFHTDKTIYDEERVPLHLQTEESENSLRTDNSTDTSEMERLFSEFSRSGSFRNRDKWEWAGLIKKFLERNHQSILEAETRVLHLLTPATQNVPSDIIVAWHYLLNEILLSYQNPSEEMLGEWIERTYRLEGITIKNIQRLHAKWRDEFKEACNSLRAVLRDLQ